MSILPNPLNLRNPLNPLEPTRVKQNLNMLKDAYNFATTPVDTNEDKPTGVLSDSASTAANFQDSLKRGAYTVTPAPVAPTTTPTPATTQTSTAGVRTPNVKTQASQVSVAPTISTPKTTTNFNTGVGREDEIRTNVQANPDAFKNRNTFNQMYGYDTADATKKAILDEEFAKGFTPKTTTKKSATDTSTTTDLFSMTQEQLDTEKKKQLETSKQADVTSAQKDYDATIGTLKTNNANLKNLYGINADGSIDESRPNSLAMSVKKDLDSYKKVQNDNAAAFESARKSRVVGQIYAQLASRGIDISKMPPEQVIALSDQVGAQAFSDIYNAKTDAINKISAKEENAMNNLNKLKEAGTLKENEYNTAVTQVEAAFNKTKDTINKNFANDIFGLADKSAARKESKSTTNLNFVNALVKDAGLSTTSASKYIADIYKKLPNATPAQVQQELLANPAFVAEAKAVQTAKAQAAAQELALKQAKTQSEIAKNIKTATKSSSSSSSSGTKPTPLSSADQLLYTDIAGFPLKTVNDVYALAQTNP
jgi:hypothetical protein